MSTPPEIMAVYGWRKDVPNIADSSSKTSIRIATDIFNSLNITRNSNESGQTLGKEFENVVTAFLRSQILKLAPDRKMKTGCLPITSFAQYAHLARIRKLAEANPTLQASLGTDYLIRPDITIGIPTNGTLHLHASISCKWTIRSDRVQNIRHEAVVMTKHRRGRQPHIVAFTAAPMPSRLAAIARGTGELDCVYHASLPELRRACSGRNEADILEELEAHERLRPLVALPEVIAYY